MAAPVIAAVALGSNLGERHGHIEFGFEAIGKLPGTRLIARSRVIETAPVGPLPQGPYLNAAASIETSLAACELLEHLLLIERARGRDRSREQRWGARTLDLDLVLYGDRIIHEEGLEVPHPRMHERLFVLEPVAEVLSEFVVPGKDVTVSELLRRIRAKEG